MTDRERHLLRTYGITEDQYQSLLLKQDNRCAICRRHQDEFSKRLAVEHSHKTREIRGLACTFCNRYVIGRNNDPEIIRRLADYLSQGTGWFVPVKKKNKRKTKKRKKRK